MECSKAAGKAALGENPDRCWYTATSGIWQTVWLEGVGEFYLDSMRLTPDVDRRCLDTEFYLNQFSEGLTLELKAFYQNKLVKQHSPRWMAGFLSFLFQLEKKIY